MLQRIEGAERRSAPVGSKPHLTVEAVSKRYGGTLAVDRVSLSLARGEFVTLLGDSGCGKTTLLRIVAGFASPDDGRVVRDGNDMTFDPPASRRIGFVFQSYALFPTKTVAQNIGFALIVARRGRAAVLERVRELAALVEIEALLDRYPHELSGGQQQRVALARALAAEPEILLLDEPMSALDARIRGKLRTELRNLVDRLGITTLYVTHDQEEALAISDRVAVMRRGRIEQVGAPSDIYHRPGSSFVAGFVGTSNLLEGRASRQGIEIDGETWPLPLPGDVAPGTAVTAMLRPEHVEVGDDDGAAETLRGRLEARTFLGSTVRLVVTLGSGRQIICEQPSSSAPAGWARGTPVRLRPDVDRLVLFPADRAL